MEGKTDKEGYTMTKQHGQKVLRTEVRVSFVAVNLTVTNSTLTYRGVEPGFQK